MVGSQLSLSFQFDVLNAKQILDAWHWFYMNISKRPNDHNDLCVFDNKLWGNAHLPMEPNDQFASVLGMLYLISQFEDIENILTLVKKNSSQDLKLPQGKLDDDVRKVIDSKNRFRNHLSEHLAFWVRLAVAIHSSSTITDFACSSPNFQPEDKGPDGIYLSVGIEDKVEIQSVKNSISNPKQLISSENFRITGIPNKGKPKQLEEFYKLAKENFGLSRLDRKLGELLRILNVTDVTHRMRKN